MAPSPEEPYSTPSWAGSPRARDHGLRRSRRLTGWIAAVSVAGAAVRGGVYTQLLQGNSAASSTPAQFPATTVGDDDGEYDEPSSHEGDSERGAAVTRPTFQPPVQAPTTTRQPAQTTTGAS
ncbi:hypothetical protein NS506_02445 [Nocardia seriolae]|uniref:Uncharacterized protein n=1 Tax=Nocardia seriolae TaxID=37332 RepID=A0ABC8AQK7_9NOCA|nr:hypothetical protein [Nocardia seriolae]APA96509.1 hypothetical protein NS506_02445 [Nocardia seriolae]